MPLFEKYKVSLVHYGHDHIINHFQRNGVHYLESSNIGNSYGSFDLDVTGAPLHDPHGVPHSLFIGDNESSYFSILDAKMRRVTICKVRDGKLQDFSYSFILPPVD